MENFEIEKPKQTLNGEKPKQQMLNLVDRKFLTVTGTTRIVSLKPDLIQLDTNFGGLIISGTNLELTKLDDVSNKAEVNGNINSLRYTDIKNKEPLLRKLFK